jgi:membrane protein implicated in regulation of membrane protease activity
MATIGAMLGAGLIVLLRWISTRGEFSLVTASLLFVAGGFVAFVKATESIEYAKHRSNDPVGRVGVALTKIGGSLDGVVKVDGMDWSARSKEIIEPGREVVVARTEGLHLLVEKPKQPIEFRT